MFESGHGKEWKTAEDGSSGSESNGFDFKPILAFGMQGMFALGSVN
jgi:hypothetical protein